MRYCFKAISHTTFSKLGVSTKIPKDMTLAICSFITNVLLFTDTYKDI